MREAEDPIFDHGPAPEPRARVRIEPLRSAPINAVLSLQRTLGNQAVVRALARATVAEPAAETDGAAKFKRAAKAGVWLTAAMSLWTLDDDEVRDLLDPLSDAELDALDVAAASSDAVKYAMPGLAEKVHRHVSFQKHAPDQSPIGWRGIVTDRGTLQHEGQVDGGGKVRVHTGTDFTSKGQKFEDGFSLKFKGKGASQSSWLQFIWREIEVDDPVRGHLTLPDVVKTPRGTPYHLTTDPANPNYNVDSPDPANPFYEADSINNRSFESTTMFDAPGAGDHYIRREFGLGATRVVSRAHFTTYLIREMDVLYAVSIDVEWEYRRPAVPAHKHQRVAGAQNATSLDPAMRERLILQYPAIDYLR